MSAEDLPAGGHSAGSPLANEDLISEARPSRHGPASFLLGDDPQRAERANNRLVGAIAGELYVQVDLGGSSDDNLAKIPFAVVPVRAGTGEKIAKIVARPIPHPHAAPGQPVMREVRREQGRFVAG